MFEELTGLCLTPNGVGDHKIADPFIGRNVDGDRYRVVGSHGCRWLAVDEESKAIEADPADRGFVHGLGV